MLDRHQNGDAANIQTELPLNSSAVVLVVDPVGCYLGEPSALSSDVNNADPLRRVGRAAERAPHPGSADGGRT